MKHFLLGIFFLSCFFSPAILPAANVKSHSKKVYIDTNDLEVGDKVIYIHFDDNIFKTNVLRTDEQGFYVYEDDLMIARGTSSLIDTRWRCPYCFKWWPKGERCQNPECPTNNW
jgi:hypothetical protein